MQDEKMKRTILMLIMFVFATSASFSQIDQVLQYFKVKDGLAKATTQAQTDGLTSPKLIYAGTFKRSVQTTVPNYGDVTININFKLSDGTSNVWLYLLSGETGSETTYKTYIVVKAMIVGFYVIEFPLDSVLNNNLPIDLSSSISTSNLMDSDAMATIFRNSTEVTAFTGKHEAEYMNVGIFSNSYMDFITKNASVWALSMETGNDFLICAIETGTQLHQCSTSPLDVEEESPVSKDGPSVYPNPAGEYIMINNSLSTHVRIYNTLGQAMDSQAVEPGQRVPVAQLPSGVYYIVTGNETKMFVKK